MRSLTGVASGDVRFTPESGHSDRPTEMSAFDPKRTSHELKSTLVENQVGCTENQCLPYPCNGVRVSALPHEKEAGVIGVRTMDE